MKRLLFYSESVLGTEIIEFEKLGITIRKMKKEEQNNIIFKYKKIIISDADKELAKKFDDIRKNKSKYEQDEIIKTYRRMVNLEETNKNSYDVIWSIIFGGVYDAYKKLSLGYINKVINNFYIIEINQNEFNKHFDENYIYTLFPKIINFSNYVSTGTGKYEKFDGIIFDFEKMINKKEECNLIVFGNLLNECEKENKINESVLLKLQNMINLKDINFGFGFMMIIDTIFKEEGLIENQIINKVSFLERLLLTKDNAKQEMFILKVGILCNGLFDISNKRLSKQLKEIYNIRSLLVHGNELKIVDNIDLYKELFSHEIRKGKNKYQTRINILIAINCILDFYFIRVLNKYLENPHLCEYIKQN